jgi:hypothetical protein
MARSVHQLLERYFAVNEELQKLMPKQYLEPTNDSLGRTWQIAVEAVSGVSDYLEDLAYFLDFKAAEAEKRAKSAKAANGSIRGADDLDQGDGLAGS